MKNLGYADTREKAAAMYARAVKLGNYILDSLDRIGLRSRRQAGAVILLSGFAYFVGAGFAWSGGGKYEEGRSDGTEYSFSYTRIAGTSRGMSSASGSLDVCKPIPSLALMSASDIALPAPCSDKSRSYAISPEFPRISSGSEYPRTLIPASMRADATIAANDIHSESTSTARLIAATRPFSDWIASYCSFVKERGEICVSSAMIFDRCAPLTDSSKFNSNNVPAAPTITPTMTAAKDSIFLNVSGGSISNNMPIATRASPAKVPQISTLWVMASSEVPEITSFQRNGMLIIAVQILIAAAAIMRVYCAFRGKK